MQRARSCRRKPRLLERRASASLLRMVVGEGYENLSHPDLPGALTMGRVAVGQPLTAPREPLPEQEHRGRIFLAVYASLAALATSGFVVLALTANVQAVILKFDGPVARAIQSVQVPVLSWVLLHTSDLGWFPYDVICVAIIAVALFALRLRLEAVVIVASTLIAGELGTL